MNPISALAIAFVLAGGAVQVGTGEALAFTAEQADRGKLQYGTQCAMCHGHDMKGPEAPPLAGSAVMQNFDTGSGLYDYFSVAMPPQAPGKLSEDVYVDILAYILQFNGAQPDGTALTADAETLDALKLAAVTAAGGDDGQAQPQQEASETASAVPQAFTFGKELPTVAGDGGDAAEAPAVPQAYTFGAELPTVN